MALVLTAGVVHAQNINFGNRANVKEKAERADANIEHRTFSWGHSGESTNFEHMIFNDVQGNHIDQDNGESMATKYDNFVIRVSGLEEGASYTVQFFDGTYGSGTVLATMNFWRDDVHIAPLPALLNSATEINKIKSVKLKSNSGSGRLTLEEAYFISAYKGLLNKKNDVYGNSVYVGYLDLNNVDIGNAYIDPSFLIRSNHLWVEIDEIDRSFTMKLDPELCSARTYFYYDGIDQYGSPVTVPVYDAVYNADGNVVTIVYDTDTDKPKYSNNDKPLISINGVETEYDKTNTPLHDNANHVVYPKYDAGDGKFSEAPTLSFSLPYESGIDMTDVTFTALDFDREANVLTRCIYENKRVDLFHDPKTNAYKAKARYQLVRDLYNSRYNSPFYDQTGEFAIDLNAVDLGDHDPNAVEENVYFPLTRTSDKAIKHVNSIYWQSYENRFLSSKDYQNATTLSTKCQDISLTKNVIKARTTRQQLDKSLYNNSDCAMVYNTEQTGSAQIFGNWNASNNGYYADLSSYKKMKISGTPNVSITVRYRTIKNGTGWTEIYAKTDNRGEVNIDLIDLRNKDDNAEGFYLNDIFFSYNQTGPYKVNNIELFNGVGKIVNLQGSTDFLDARNMFHLWNNDDNYKWQYGTIVQWNDPQYVWNPTADGGELIIGHDYTYDHDSYETYSYADLTGYKAIRVYGDGQYGFYFNINTIEDQDPEIDCVAIIDAEQHDDGETYAEFDISNFDFFHLNGIYGVQNPHGVSRVSLVENEEVDYILYGNGSCYEQKKALKDNSVVDAVNDKTAKVIDARPRCNNMEEPFERGKFGWVQQTQLPYTANHNALYIQRKNQFENRDVKDDGKTYEKVNFITPSNIFDIYGEVDPSYEYFTSNNIKLEDGYSFYAPKKIKADETSFERTFTVNNQDGVVNSIILPFAVNADNYNVESNNKNYGFYETFGVKQSNTTGEKMAGILNEQDVKTNDWMIKFKQKSENTDANTPYLYAVKESNTTVFTGVATEDNKVIIPETPNVGTSARDNMTNYDEEVTVFDGKESFYLRGVYEPTYMENILFYSADGTLYRTPYMTVTPFRTIIKSPIDVEENDTDWHNSQGTYFSVSGNVKVVLALNVDDESLDINSLVADGIFAEDEPIYNVAGQRVNTFGKGIYIVGGKKILVK